MLSRDFGAIFNSETEYLAPRRTLNGRAILTERVSTTDGLTALCRDGWTVYRNMLEAGFVARLQSALEALYARRREVQRQNGIADGMAGTCHHLLGDDTAMDELVSRLPLHDLIGEFLEGPYILNSFGGFMNPPRAESGYIGRVHRDVRTYSQDFKMMINVLIMLDEFTAENGATFVLPKSHLKAGKPADAAFRAGALQLLGGAGDIAAFDSRLWHAAGANRSNGPRRALTLTYTRPFLKQQLDYPRYLGDAYKERLRPEVRQVLGYNARVPESIEAFYQPRENRAYQPDQE